jgi:nucleoside-diphosphate-sugar epimerase
MNKILITGVAGLLGSRLADWIIENKPNVEVWGLDDLSGGYQENVNSKVKFIKVNLFSKLKSLIMYFTLPLMQLKDYHHLLEHITMITILEQLLLL